MDSKLAGLVICESSPILCMGELFTSTERESSGSIWLLKCIGHVVRRAIKLSKLMIEYRIYPCTHKVRPRKGCGDHISSHFSYQSQVYIESVASCRSLVLAVTACTCSRKGSVTSSFQADNQSTSGNRLFLWS